jgi:hypothetical protein
VKSIVYKVTRIYRGKAIPVTRRGSPQDSETPRLPHFLDNLLSDGGEVVSLTRRPPFNPRKIPSTVKPRFTKASDHEQFGLRTNFPNTKRLG